MLILREGNCPICDSPVRTYLGRPGKVGPAFRRFPQADEVQIARCGDCSGMYVSPMTDFSPELQAELYNIEYFQAEGAVQSLKNMGEKEEIFEIVKALAGGNLEGRTLLDIGCGTGEFLVVGARHGMRVTGTDVEPSITAHVREQYGFDVVTGLFGPETFPAASFDVIVLSHVIEHLQQPYDMLAAIHRTLKPGGLFVMCTPNTDSLMELLHDLYGRFRYDRHRSYYLSPFTSPFHIVGFNLKAARRVLERAGFAPAYARVHSGLEWEETNRRAVMRTIKMTGALLHRGMNIITVSRKA